jgi:hypothetical protein
MTRWKNIAVKIEPEMYEEIQEYSENGQFDSFGASVRDLLAYGLETASGRTGVEQRVIRANAVAAAKRRLHVILQGAIKMYEKDMALEGEDEEDLDDQYDIEE